MQAAFGNIIHTNQQSLLAMMIYRGDIQFARYQPTQMTNDIPLEAIFALINLLIEQITAGCVFAGNMQQIIHMAADQLTDTVIAQHIGNGQIRA